MKDINLTDEQQAVIHHPIGMHAWVLAVAGSGKSYTMACRIKHLVMDCSIPPHAMRVLMFNTLARQQFRSHLEQTGLPEAFSLKSIPFTPSAIRSSVRWCAWMCCQG